MSFQQGLSGLSAAAKNLDVIGNNVANSETVGFKGSRTEFADMFASNLSGGTGNQAGIGAKASAVSQQFNQGNISTTGNPLDLAISGKGFFQTTDKDGAISYSRNGQFHLDREGYIVTNSGLKLNGYPVDRDSAGNIKGNGVILDKSPEVMRIDTSSVGAVATGAQSGIVAKYTLNSMSSIVDPSTPASLSTAKGGPFKPNDPQSYNYSRSLTVYDTLGNEHTMQTYFAKRDPMKANGIEMGPTLSRGAINSAATAAVQTVSQSAVNNAKIDISFDNTGAAVVKINNGTALAAVPLTGVALPQVGDVSSGVDLTFTYNADGSIATVTAAESPAGAVPADTVRIPVTIKNGSTATAVDNTQFSFSGSGNNLYSQWDVYTTIAGTNYAGGVAASGQNPDASGTDRAIKYSLRFDQNGSLAEMYAPTVVSNVSTTGDVTPGSGTAVVVSGGVNIFSQNLFNGLTTPVLMDAKYVGANLNGGPGSPNILIDQTGTKQTNASNGVEALSQDGSAPGRLSTFEFDQSGILIARYTNGLTRKLGQVALVNFANVQGLTPSGDNQWKSTYASGDPLVDKPGLSGLGIIQSTATEDSNVDLTQELVKMVVAQRSYQANTQTIKVQDTLLQGLLALR